MTSSNGVDARQGLGGADAQPAGGPADLSPQAVSAKGAHQAQGWSNFRILLDRVEAAGVRFGNRPFRLHHQSHGQLRDTFFVWDDTTARTPLNTMVDWVFDDGAARVTGCEAAISRFDATSLYRFVRGPLWLMKDDGSGYGVMLMVSETPPDQWHQYDLLASLPTLHQARSEAQLLRDANSYYSAAQLEEIERAAIAERGK